MKYRRLSKEEFESLAEDFAIFLASNSIDKKEWDRLKNENRDRAEEVLNIFSDMVFEKALKSARYLRRVSDSEIQCYLFQEKQAHMISIRSLVGNRKSLLENDLGSFGKDEIEITQGTKKFTKSREEEMFAILQTGAELSDGKLYQQLLALL